MPGVPGASDVAQETNLILWKKRQTFEIGTNFKAWAFTIARNEVRSHLRRQKKRTGVALDPQLLEELSEESAGSAEEMNRWMDALEGCLLQLKPEHRKLVQSRYGDSSAEVLTGAIRAKLHRIRIALRNCIATTLSLSPDTQPQ